MVLGEDFPGAGVQNGVGPGLLAQTVAGAVTGPALVAVPGWAPGDGRPRGLGRPLGPGYARGNGGWNRDTYIHIYIYIYIYIYTHIYIYIFLNIHSHNSELPEFLD